MNVLKTLPVVVLLCVSIASLSTVAYGQTDYTVGAQDVLTITVFGEPDLSGKYTVEQDGSFTYPQLGRVKVGGLTLRALEEELKKQLADGYLRNPQVAVAVENYRSQRILIMGEVRAPGEYQIAGEMTLLSALARAGSTTPTAGRQIVIVRRKRPSGSEAGSSAAKNSVPPADGESEIIRIDLHDLQTGNMALNVGLRDGDTINVPKALSVFVTGQVRAPGAYSVDRDTTVLQVLSLAGGLTERGAEGRIRILRAVDGKPQDMKAKLTDVVEPGDTVVVPERYF